MRSRLSRHLPLSGLRLVTTLPPNPWFGGNNFVQARVHTRALRELGAEVYEFDTAAIYANDVDRIARQKREIIEFRPDAAVSTPNAGYIVQGGQRTGRAGPPGSRALNLFIEELELPVVLFWDHGLTQPAHYLLLPTPDHPEQSQGGALSILKRLFVHPNIVHLFPDTGHAEELARLGLASFGADDFYVQGVGHAFMEVGDRVSAGDSFDHEVAFFGNIYLAASGKLPYAAQPEFTQLRRRVSETRSANPRLSFYHAYRDAIAALQPSARSRLRLDPDQSFYWRVMFDELTHYMNGEERLRAMQSCGRAVDFFGNFNDPDSNTLMPAACRSRGALPYGPQLAESFRRTRVTVDVANAAFINGFSVKLVDCFASGGFALTDRKADVARAFGPIADEISYDGAEELAAKVDFYLGRPDRRRDIAREIGATVREKYSTHTLFTDVIPKALQRLSRPVWRRLLGYRRSARLDPSPPVVRPLMGVSLDLVHTAPHWTGASVIKGRPVAIQTVDAPWGYSAILPLRALRERHVAEPGKLFWEIDAEAAEGTSSIGVIKGDQMLSEQLVDGRETFYLPADEVDADLIVRNGPQEGSSRVLIHRLRLVWVKRS